jgi:hypothetical protein
MRGVFSSAVLCAAVATLVTASAMPLAGQAGAHLVVFSDMALFAGPGKPGNCFLQNRFKHGDPVGFRVRVIDGATGEPADGRTTVTVHLSYGGKTTDVPARYRDTTGANPDQRFWTAKWIVPADAPTGVLGYTVTAADPSGRTAEYKELPVALAQLTIVDQ